MTWLDWAIVAFTVLLAIYGHAQGFIVGMLSLGGFALGAFVGTRLGPLLLPGGAHSPDAPLFGLVGALLAGGVLATSFEGIGAHARAALRLPGLRALDGIAGAGLTAAVALGMAWILGAIALQTSGSADVRRTIQRSAILRGLNGLLPPSGPLLNALARFDPLPTLHGSVSAVPPPPRGIAASAGARSARASIVRIRGSACGLGVEGSGWIAAPGVVVTNAHVVAGETDTTMVEPGGGPVMLQAQAIGFDPRDDLAILRVPGLSGRPLAIRTAPPAGTPVAILGFPLDGQFDAEPARLGDTATVNTEDAYGDGPVERQILALRGRVRPGNSGGPLIDAAGRVNGTVFAAVTGPAHPAGFAVPNALVTRDLSAALHADRVVGTGDRCAS